MLKTKKLPNILDLVLVRYQIIRLVVKDVFPEQKFWIPRTNSFGKNHAIEKKIKRKVLMKEEQVIENTMDKYFIDRTRN